MCDYCSWIKLALEKTKIKDKVEEKKTVVEPVIVVHGGAGRIPKFERNFMMEEVKNAAKEAYEKLVKGMNAMDAVVSSISHMESKKYFNCAKGGSLDVNGEVVMDAAMMDNNLKIGCVGAVRDIEHPILLAKSVLQETDHVLIVEQGAQKFALSMGIPVLPPGWLLLTDTPPSSLHSQDYGDCEAEDEFEGFANFHPEINDDVITQSIITEEEVVPLKVPTKKLAQCIVRRLAEEEEERKKALEMAANEPTYLEVSAVGAVAFDRERKFVCGTSTTGNRGKMIGSVSSIGTVVGCGIFADGSGCVSVSGDDKKIYAHTPARKFVERLKNEELEDFELETDESNIGAIALNAAGEPAVFFKSMHFPWAFCQKGWIHYGCAKDEKFSERITTLERPLDCMCKE